MSVGGVGKSLLKVKEENGRNRCELSGKWEANVLEAVPKRAMIGRSCECFP